MREFEAWYEISMWKHQVKMYLTFKTKNNKVHEQIWQNNKPYGWTLRRLTQYTLKTQM